MKKFRWLTVALFCIVVSSLLLLASTGTVQADSVKLNLKELTNGADSILVGTVTERSSYWNDEHTRIYTSVVFSVEDRMKGDAGPQVTITVPGGTVDGIGEWVSDMVSFDQGEKSVVFLKKLTTTQLPEASALQGQIPEEQFEVYYGSRGKFPVRGDRVDSLPVSEFKGRVNSILSGQALPSTELDIAPSVVTMPYSYAGYSWPHPPAPVVPYRINENTSDCTGEGTAMQSAAATWSASGANFSFSYAGTTAATDVGYDGVNEIMWANMGAVSTLAVTYIWYSGSTILENDTKFNDYYSWSTSSSCPSGYYDVQTVGLHEMGHWLCLDDLYGAGDSAKVMYGYGYSGQLKRALTADDIAGIRSIYGISSLPLSVTTTSLPDGTVGVPYSQTLQATGGTGSYTWSITSGSLPGGLSLTSSTGLISGPPTTAGTSNFTVQVNDGSTTASKSLSISIFNKLLGANDIAGTGTHGGNYFILQRFQAEQSGTMSLFRIKCEGSGNVKVAVYHDASGEPGDLLTAVNTSTPVVAGWNSINLAAPQTINAGAFYWLAVNADTNVVLRPQTTGSGVYRYRAATYSTFNFPDSAGTGFTNGSGYTTLLAGCGSTSSTPLAITTTSLPDGTVGVTYSQTLQATGGTGSYSWSITSGSLPDGLSLTSSTGLISGPPTTAGTFNFTAQVNDGSTTDDQPLSIIINSPTLTITTTALPDGTVGVDYSQTLQATGGTGSYTWSITSGSLPGGLNLTAGSGLISGPPTTAGTSNFTVQVNDGSTTDDQSLSITISPAGTTQKLLGANDIAGTGTHGGNYFILQKFQAEQSGTMSTFKVKCAGSGNVKVAVYHDASGEPGNLMTSVDTSTPVVADWNSINLAAPQTINAGAFYWLAVNADTNVVLRPQTSGSGVYRYRAATYSTFNFPDSAGTGFTNGSGYTTLLAGWGVTGSPTLPDSPSLLSPGTAITFKWGSSTGATTYWLQVNTASDFAGTDIFNAEVGNVTTQEVTGFSLGTAYYWRVKAGNSAGWSPWSEVRSVVSSIVP